MTSTIADQATSGPGAVIDLHPACQSVKSTLGRQTAPYSAIRSAGYPPPGTPRKSLYGPTERLLGPYPIRTRPAEDAERWFTKCGLHLRNVKAALPHGQFRAWCSDNGISKDQAARWMAEAAEPAKREERQAKDREGKKSRRHLRHLNEPQFPAAPLPKGDPAKDLWPAPEPDLRGLPGRIS